MSFLFLTCKERDKNASSLSEECEQPLEIISFESTPPKCYFIASAWGVPFI